MARRADSHCTCCGSTQAFPARLRIMMSGPPLPTLALGRTRSPRCTERLEQRAAHDVFDIPTTKRQRAQVIGGGHVGARARSAHASAPSAQREAATGLPKAPGRAARAIGAERVARGGDGSQRLPCPAQRRAAPSAPSAERGARDGDQARCTAPWRAAPAPSEPSAQREARAALAEPAVPHCVHSEHCDDLIRHDWEAIAC